MSDQHKSDQHTEAAAIIAALASDDVQVRLQAALAAGTAPEPAYVDVLLERAGLEPDFFVREMLTWGLLRQPVENVLDLLINETQSENEQARSQSLHTLSKIGHPDSWVAMTLDNLHHVNDDVARTAWRAAAALVPMEEISWLATELIKQLGRGNREVMLSLSRAIIELDDTILPLLWEAQASTNPLVQAHAIATEQLYRDPASTFSIQP